MRLTNDKRRAFVNAVIADVPKVDYKEQIRKLLLDAAVEMLPEPIRKIWDNPELRHYLGSNYIYCFNVGVGVAYPRNIERESDFSIGVLDAVDNLDTLDTNQNEKIEELKTKLTSLVNGCSTLKQLKLAVPELEKYMPADNQLSLSHTNRSLPVVTNVMADLAKAGWKETKV